MRFLSESTYAQLDCGFYRKRTLSTLVFNECVISLLQVASMFNCRYTPRQSSSGFLYFIQRDECILLLAVHIFWFCRLHSGSLKKSLYIDLSVATLICTEYVVSNDSVVSLCGS